MNPKGCYLLITLTFAALFSAAQKKDLTLFLRSGEVKTINNILPEKVADFNARANRVKNKTFAIIQFDEIPNESVKRDLKNNGIELLEYIPENAYTVIISGNVNHGILQKAKARSLIQLSPQQKMFPALAALQVPNWAVKVPGTIDVLIKFPKAFNAPEVVQLLKEKNIEVISDDLKKYNVLSLRIAANRLQELAAYPFIEYVQPQPPKDQPLNLNSRNGSRANALNASASVGGKALNGEGVVVGIGDNADVQFHVDFTGRLINRAATSLNNHGTHTTGTLAGGGIVNEQLRGYAPKATIVSQVFSGILNNAATYVNDYGMVVTNNSYGNIVACDYHGTYDIYSGILDQQAFDLPYLQHVFAAGNSGGDNCAPYPQGFRTVLGGYQTAKNVLSVGNTEANGTIAGNSSKGPVKDGRTKPEIAAMGSAVLSTIPTNNYGYGWGTSMASPAVSGGLALLYQRYRQLHGNANPKSGLIKALACNGATDKGAAGPDFSYGFGWMNLLRSVDMMEKGRYFTASVANANTATHTIAVPPNTAQLKVMLYWHDPAASIISSKALVNDLDLEVKDAANNITLPKKLDTTAANVTAAAMTGTDHINNIEQVVINTPAEGVYTINVKGTSIAQNPSQEYFIVYDIIPAAVTLTYPFGGEALVPGEQITIQWDANDNNSNTFDIQYSTDNGTSWNNIATSVAAATRQLAWTVPSTITSNALVRIRQNETSPWSTSGSITVIAVPTISLSTTQCEGYITLNWSAVSGATDYDVMMLRGDEMMVMANTSSNTYTFNSLSKDSIYWITVRARLNDKAGRRATAISRQPNTGTCTGSVSDGDLKLNAITAPSTGRQFTSSALTGAETIKIEIKNLDDAPVNSFTVQYSVNNGPWITENINTTIAAGATYLHQFVTKADLSAAGNYTIVAVVKNTATDNATINDTLVKQVKNIGNQPVDLTGKFLDNVDGTTSGSYKTFLGIAADERYDFWSSTSYGRLRTFVNSGMAFSGNGAFTLDADRYISTGNTNYLTGTFNLSNYYIGSNDVRLDFLYNNHGEDMHADNKVWIRGSDQDAWIEAYDLAANQADIGIYKKTSSIEISELLAKSNQQLTGSFQVKWGQFGVIQATDKEGVNGYTFDDIRLYEADNDIQMLGIEEPFTNSCGLDNTSPVKISIRNSASKTLNNIPVQYRINGGGWVQEVIPSIAAKSTLTYTFVTTPGFTAFGNYTAETVVNYAADNFHENDTAINTITNSPIVNSFPYLQNFEGDNGYWYASGGKNSSWQYGTPASYKITGAASGAKAWKTRLAGNYNDNEFSYLYSPCFNITGMTNPAISFSVALDIEDCGSSLCDGAWLEYTEDGRTWKKLGSNGSGTNWYNKATDQLWSIENYTRWHVATAALPANLSRMQLRFVFRSDAGVSREGIAIDDIHIYDNTKGIFDGVTLSAPVTQSVGATGNWVDFESGGKLFASVNSANQVMGNTKAQVFVFNDYVRNTYNQYYHARNITIRPENAVTDSVTVRFYFLDSETDALINAKSCAMCSKPASAYKLGISKFSGAEQLENGTISDNSGGIWKFIPPVNVAIVPFDKGYYAEFKVADFSEFWLNNGAFDNMTPLPVKLLNFEAKKQNENVVLQWATATEENADRFEIELATGNTALQNNRFIKIGEVPATGNSNSIQTYTFVDEAPFKTGVRYYRLKEVDKDGKSQYSIIRSVLFTDELTWKIFPNPSTDVFNFMYQAAAGESVLVQLLDATGRKLDDYRLQGNGFTQKLVVNTVGKAAGVYLLQVTYNGKKQIFKLYKQ